MAKASTITDLLSMLADNQKNVTWKIKCSYADGMGNSYHEIRLYRKPNKLDKVIVFQMESGQIVKQACKGVSSLDSEDIVDFLLDLIINKENPFPYFSNEK